MNDVIEKNKTSRIFERIRILYNIFREYKIQDIYREFIWMRNAECKADDGIGKRFGIAMITLR